MFKVRRWSASHSNYCSQQIELVAQWSAKGSRCAMIGIAGCGKSNSLGFLSHKQDAFFPKGKPAHQPFLPVY